MRTIANRTGNVIVETLLMIPLLALILAGSYACLNTLSLLSIAESATHAEALREGRRQPDDASRWNATVEGNENPFIFKRAAGNSGRLLPSPFPALAGRSSATVTVDRPWDPWARRSLSLERQTLRRDAELSADCWDETSGSGRKIRNVVKILAVSGVL